MKNTIQYIKYAMLSIICYSCSQNFINLDMKHKHMRRKMNIESSSSDESDSNKINDKVNKLRKGKKTKKKSNPGTQTSIALKASQSQIDFKENNSIFDSIQNDYVRNFCTKHFTVSNEVTQNAFNSEIGKNNHSSSEESKLVKRLIELIKNSPGHATFTNLKVEDLGPIGQGLFSKDAIPQGYIIGIFTGHIAYTKKLTKQEQAYSWALTENLSVYSPEYEGSILRKVNSASDKNNFNIFCRTVFSEIPFLLYIASKDIKPGEQLIIDYGDDYWSESNRPLSIYEVENFCYNYHKENLEKFVDASVFYTNRLLTCNKHTQQIEAIEKDNISHYTSVFRDLKILDTTGKNNKHLYTVIACEPIPTYGLITKYTGLLRPKETKDYYNTEDYNNEFVFDLNDGQVIDSSTYGNVSAFIERSTDPSKCNVIANRLVNEINVYATKPIITGERLILLQEKRSAR